MTAYDLQTLERINRELSGLEREFAGVVPPESFRQCAEESLARYEGARVKEFVPLLVYRTTRQRVMELASTLT